MRTGHGMVAILVGLWAVAGACSSEADPATPSAAHPVRPAEGPTPPDPSAALPRGADLPGPDRDPEPTKRETTPTPDPTPKPTPDPTPKTSPSPKPSPTPKPTPNPEPTARPGVRVPNTSHVRVVLTPGMQSLLDADPRMQPWVNAVMRVADRCYAAQRAKDASAGGTIVATATMHQNARPTVDIDTLPPALAGVVACATGDLMRNRMPLFTGPEGQRHRLQIRFTP